MTADLTTRIKHTDLPASKPPVNAQSVTDLLTLAASHAERSGSAVRLVHDFGRVSLRCTVIDAVYRAAEESGAVPEVRGEALRLVKRYLRVDDLVAWSKTPGRSSAEVVEGLRGAAVPAERTPFRASTHGRDPFEVLGVRPDAEDDIPF